MKREEIAAELRWYFRTSPGELGLRSNLTAIVARIEGGNASAPDGVDERRLASAARARRVARELAGLTPEQKQVLFSAYGTDAEPPLLWVMYVLPEAREEHRASRSLRGRGEWLYRLCLSAKDGGDLARRRLFAKIHALALNSVGEALDAYSRQHRERESNLESGLFSSGIG